MTPLFFIFIFILPAGLPDDTVWVGGDKGIREVPIYYVDEVHCNGFNEHNKGCYSSGLDAISFLKGYDVHTWAMPGCSIWNHEIIHAWGYDHVSMQIFNCPNPNVDYDSLQYDETFVKHWDPNYEWEGYGK